MRPLTEQERDGVLDSLALLEAWHRDDQVAVAVVLNATSDPAQLRRVASTVAYLAAQVEDVTDPEVLAAIRRTFAGRATSP